MSAHDTLSDVLRTVRLRTAVFYYVSCDGEWVAEAPTFARHRGGRHAGSRARHGVSRADVRRMLGRSRRRDAIRMRRGDVVLLPHGDAHVVSSAPGMRADPAVDSYFERRARSGRFASITTAARRRMLDLDSQPPPPSAAAHRRQFVCGFIGCDLKPFNPLIATLPRMLHLPAEGRSALSEQFATFAAAESASRRPGSEALLERLSEMMFVDAIRRHVEQMPPADDGLARGLARPLRRPRARAAARAARRAVDDRGLEQPGGPLALGAARAVRVADRPAARAIPDELAHAARVAAAARGTLDGRDGRRRRRLRLRGRVRARVQAARRHAAGRVAPRARARRGTGLSDAALRRTRALAVVCALGLAAAAAADESHDLDRRHERSARPACSPTTQGRGGLTVLGGYVANLRAARAADGGAVLRARRRRHVPGRHRVEPLGRRSWSSTRTTRSATTRSRSAITTSTTAPSTRAGPSAEWLPRHVRDASPGDMQGALKAAAARARFPFLAANIVEAATGEPVHWPNVTPSALVEAAGVRVGLIGMMTETGLRQTLAAHVVGLDTRPLAPTVAARGARAARARRRDRGARDARRRLVRRDVRIRTIFRRATTAARSSGSRASCRAARCRRSSRATRTARSRTSSNAVPIISVPNFGAQFGRMDLEFDTARRTVTHVRIHEPQRVCARIEPRERRLRRRAGRRRGRVRRQARRAERRRRGRDRARARRACARCAPSRSAPSPTRPIGRAAPESRARQSVRRRAARGRAGRRCGARLRPGPRRPARGPAERAR